MEVSKKWHLRRARASELRHFHLVLGVLAARAVTSGVDSLFREQ